jgi:hypothetical protein
MQVLSPVVIPVAYICPETKHFIVLLCGLFCNGIVFPGSVGVILSLCQSIMSITVQKTIVSNTGQS